MPEKIIMIPSVRFREDLATSIHYNMIIQETTTVANRYLLVKLLGQGGMGEVYQATDTELGKEVALKVLSKMHSDHVAFFDNEFLTLAKLKHPYLAEVYDFGCIEIGGSERRYFTMELVNGENIEKFVRRQTTVSHTVICPLLVQILEALAYIHSRKIIHGDIKPSNILICHEGNQPRVKLIDFGLSTSMNWIKEPEVIAGTIDYLSPERIQGKFLDRRSDIYSLGVVLYELLSGRPLFKGRPSEILTQHLTVVPVNPTVYNPDLPSRLDKIVLRMLQKDPARRYQNTQEIISDLSEITDCRITVESRKMIESYVMSGGFVGREEILGALRSMTEHIQKTRRGEMALVFGETGVGKSRLMREFKRFIQTNTYPIFSYTCYDDRSAEYKPVTELLRQMVKWSESFAPRIFEEHTAGLQPLLPEFFELGEKIIPVHFSESDRIRLQDAIFRFVLQIAQERPIIIYIDDAQWVDKGTQDVLRYFLRNIRDIPLGIVLNLNTDYPETDKLRSLFKSIQPVIELSLSNFTREQIRELVASMLGIDDIPEILIDQLMSQTLGNPLFIEEYMKTMADEGLLLRQNNTWVFDIEYIDRIMVHGLDDALNRRLAGLNNKQLDILKIFAVANQSLSFEVIARVGDYKPEILQEILLTLQSDKIIYPELSEGKIHYTFYHNKFRSLIYAHLSEPERVDLHLRFARVMEQGIQESPQPAVEKYRRVEAIAYHYQQGQDGDRAIAYLLEAGKKSRALYAITASLQYYEDAHHWLDEESRQGKYIDERLQVHEILGELYQLQGMHEKAIDQFTRMYAVAESQNRLREEAKALERIGVINTTLGHITAALTNLANAEAIYRELDHRQGLADVLSLFGNAYSSLGDMEQAIRYYHESLALRQEEGDPERIAACYNNLALLYSNRGDYDTALNYHRQAISLRGSAGAEADLSVSHLNLGGLLLNKGDYEQSEEHYRKGLELKRLHGDKPGEAVALRGLGVVYTNLGEYDHARRYFEEAFDIERRIDNPIGLAMTFYYQAELEICSGYYDVAMGKYEQALRIVQASHHRRLESTILYRQGRLYFFIGDRQRAMENMTQALDLAIKIKFQPQVAEIRSFTGYLHILDNDPGSMKMITEGVAKARQIGNFWIICECEYLQAYAHLHLSEYEASLRVCHDLLSYTEKINNREYNAKILLLMTHIFIKMRQWEDALACVTKARTIAETLRMPYIEMKTENYFGQIYFHQRQWNDARIHLQSFQDILRELLFHIPESYHPLYREAKSRFEDVDFDLPEKLEAQIREEEKIQEQAAVGHAILKDTLSRIDAAQTVSMKELHAIYEMAQTINSILDLNQLLEKIMDIVIETVHAERGMIFLKEGQEWTVHVARNISKETIRDVTEVSHSIIESVSSTGKAIFAIDARDDQRFKDKKSIVQLDIVSFMCIPLNIKNESIGVVYVDNRNMVGRFNQKNLDFLSLFANLAGIAIENARLHAQLTNENIKLKEENILLKSEITRQFEIETNIKGSSEAIRKVLNLIKVATKVNSNVLLEGESGTGKELVARAIHFNSLRKNGKFVPVNCGALTETLLESELFGHKRGAFSGAIADKKGLFEEAEGGTLFLDEITNTTRNMQAKLLRVLQDGEFRRVGDTQIRRVDVRIISATNLDLAQEVKAGRFREDLYYRLKVIYIVTPPLRQRKEDIIQLAYHFLAELNRTEGHGKKLSAKAIELLLAYDWPGNVRELRNKIEQAYAISDQTIITEECFPDLLIGEKRKERITSGFLKERMDQIERRILIEELKKHQWNIQKTAQDLGLSRRSIYDKLEKFGIKREDDQRHDMDT